MQQVKKVNLDNVIKKTGSAQNWIMWYENWAKTVYKIYVEINIIVLKKSNIDWESRQDVDIMFDLISRTAIL